MPPRRRSTDAPSSSCSDSSPPDRPNRAPRITGEPARWRHGNVCSRAKAPAAEAHRLVSAPEPLVCLVVTSIVVANEHLTSVPSSAFRVVPGVSAVAGAGPVSIVSARTAGGGAPMALVTLVGAGWNPPAPGGGREG